MSATQQQFLDVIDRDEAERRFHAALDLSPLEAETVPLSQAHGRVLADDVAAPIDVPSFDRGNVDGFAVRAEDTFGASEDTPRLLERAVPIATGGMLPRAADAVVMIEHTDVREGELFVSRPVAPGANVTFAGTDIGMGEVVLRGGDLLTARETGVLAALGLDRVAVVRRPRVAVVSTGDELLPPGAAIRPGMVHDSNGTVLADTVRELGGEPVPLGIVPDDDAALDAALASALDCDMVLLSGGTSKGAGDLSYRAVARAGRIVAHGVALKPGKPLCLAVTDRPGKRAVPVAVLPGFPTSAIFTFHEFLAPVLRRLAGRRDEAATTLQARLPMRVNSERGRTEYLLVGLVASAVGTATWPVPGVAHQDKQGACPTAEWTAYPMGKGSGSVTAFSRADGFVVIPRQREYLEKDSVVEVRLLARGVTPADLVVIGSHCLGLDYLLGLLHRRGLTSKVLSVGSTGGLEAARRGECDLAGVHLLDPATDRYNEPFLTPGLTLVKGYVRRQGIVFRPGDLRFRGSDLTAALTDPECILVNRNRGSGTRLLIDRLLGAARPPGYLTEARSHNAVVAAVAQGRADWGVAIEPAARALQLDFHPLRDEEYDFVVPEARLQRPAVRAFVDLLQDVTARAALAERGFARLVSGS